MFRAHRARNFLNYFLLKFPSFPAIQTRSLSTTSSLFNLCKKPDEIQQIHARFILLGLHQNQSLFSKLIDSYADFGLLRLSQKLFDSIETPSLLLYNTILQNLSKSGEFERVLLVYQEMVKQGVSEDEEIFPFVLGACSCLLDVELGKRVHSRITKLGFDSSEFISDALAQFYLGFGDFENEHKVFDKMSVRDLSYWNTLISQSFLNGDAEESFRVFRKMRMENLEPNGTTIINLLRSCVDLGSFDAGRALHCVALVSDLGYNLSVNTALLSMYSKLGRLNYASLVFETTPERDCVVWNIMISAFAQHGQPKKSLDLLRLMGKFGVKADIFTVIPAISAIRQLKSALGGKEMHACVVRNGLDSQVSVHNSLIDMYSECDCLDYAQKIFDSIAEKTGVSWSSMIKGFVTHDRNLEALFLFSKMKMEGIEIDFVTVINILPACVNVGALEQVKHLHGYSMKTGLNALSSVNSVFLISYAKCGCIEMARKLFDEEQNVTKDVITWNSMISAFAKHGDWIQCFNLYDQMKKSGLKPDGITFLALLTSCVNSGLVKEGRKFFKEMREKYGCRPSQEHYAAMVDLLGRAGHISEARELVNSMPIKPDARVWGPLLSACRMHSETKLAEFAAEQLIAMEPQNAGNYVLLSRVYAAAGKWDKFAKMRRVLRERGLKKTPGLSWLEIEGRVYEFSVADRSHPKADSIYDVLGILESEIKDACELDEKVCNS